MHYAAKKDNRSTLKLLLNKYKLNINSKAVTGTPLHVAADVGNLEVVKLLVNKGANINFKAGEANTTPLILAARRGFFDICDFLVANQAQVNLSDDSGWTALYSAAEMGFQNIVQFFLEKDANPDQPTIDGNNTHTLKI